jgi:hypothetical protein
VLVSEAVAARDAPKGSYDALARTGYADKPLSELLTAFFQLEPEFRRLSNIGQRSVAAIRQILCDTVMEELQRRGFSKPEAADAGALLLDRSDLGEGGRARLSARLAGVDSTAIPLIASAPQSPATLLRILVAGLRNRDCDVLTRRFGLGRPVETRKEVARQYGLSRARIQQIEAEAIRRLRLRGKRALTASVLAHGQPLWDALANGEILIRAADLAASCRRVPRWFALALNVAGLHIEEWLNRFGRSFGDARVPGRA